jgi:hypothetical protein
MTLNPGQPQRTVRLPNPFHFALGSFWLGPRTVQRGFGRPVQPPRRRVSIYQIPSWCFTLLLFQQQALKGPDTFYCFESKLLSRFWSSSAATRVLTTSSLMGRTQKFSGLTLHVPLSGAKPTLVSMQSDIVCRVRCTGAAKRRDAREWPPGEFTPGVLPSALRAISATLRWSKLFLTILCRTRVA